MLFHSRIRSFLFALWLPLLTQPFQAVQAQQQDEVEQLRQEVAGKGWIAYSARSDNGTWDIFLIRPDGSAQRNITSTPETEEAAPRFSPDGKQLLWRRLPKGTVINHDQWGFQGQVVIAENDGTLPKELGKDGEYTWASWSPQGNQLACLTRAGIQIVDATTGTVVEKLPRKGFFQQLFWSPDGRYFTGVANYEGKTWTVVRMAKDTGAMNAVKVSQNCTPDWFPDSEHVIFSSRPPGQKANDGYGWTYLWTAKGTGEESRLVYGEENYHIYGGGVSPDGKYVLLTRCPVDGGGSEKDGAPISIIRLADTPMIQGESKEIRHDYPDAKSGPMLPLAEGWEPHWTYTEIPTP